MKVLTVFIFSLIVILYWFYTMLVKRINQVQQIKSDLEKSETEIEELKAVRSAYANQLTEERLRTQAARELYAEAQLKYDELVEALHVNFSEPERKRLGLAITLETEAVQYMEMEAVK
jgi:F0F1-type ATP synthase membrane subunit b/b'